MNKPSIDLENKFSSLEVSDTQEDFPDSSQRITEEILDDSDDELSHEIAGIKENVQKLDSAQAGYTSSLEFTQAQVEDLRKENSALQQYLDDIELEVQRNRYAIDKLEGRQTTLETASRKKNLTIEGLTETNHARENIHETVGDLFKAMGIDQPVQYDQVYRIGPYHEKKTRAVFISFPKMDDRNFVYSQRAALKQSPHHYNVWVNDDVPPEARRNRTVVRQLTKDAKDAGATCSSTQQAIIIDGKRYDLSNLQSLPAKFSLESAKTKQVNDTDIAYHSEHSPFSNLYPCTITVRKTEFCSVEQVLQYKKAKHFNKPEVMRLIKLSRDNYEIRQLGKNLGQSKEWDEKVEEVMFAAILRKFDRDEALLAKLLATGTKRLVEATPDKKWGAGVSISSKAIRTGTWPGENRQGILLMQVRDKLRAERKQQQDREGSVA